MTNKRGRYHFSMRSLFAWVAASGFALAFPHVAVFLVSLVCVVLASRATYRSVKGGRPRFSLIFAFMAAWTAFYALSIGPFIALSEFERRVFDRYYIGNSAELISRCPLLLRYRDV